MSETPRTDAERARIERQLDGEPDNVAYVLDQMGGHAKALELENARLRAALAPFAALTLWPDD